MEKTYFEQLLQKLGEIKNPSALTKIVMEDVYKRSMDWISHFDDEADGYNSDYILRQLTYLTRYLNK